MSTMIAATLGGFALAGPMGAAAGLAGALAWPRVRARRRAAARARELATQMPDVMRAIAAAVRAGRNLPQAIEAARDELAEPARGALARAADRFTVGGSLDDALDAFTAAAAIPDAARVADTIGIARESGGDLPRVLDVAIAAMLERARIERDRHAATAQARLSALVVGGMPVAFLLIAGPTARAQLALLVREPIGWVLLGIGGLLEVAGVLWIRRLTRPRGGPA